MPRYTLAAASLFVALPAVAQTARPDALAPRPAASLDADARMGAALDGPISDDQLALRLARIYERQAQLLAADADGNRGLYNRLLDDLVADLQALARRPGVMFDGRFREAYSSVLTEQERFYGQAALDRGDVYAVREAGLRAVELGFDLGAPLLEHVTLPERGTFATAIPMDVNPHVQRYVQFLVGRRGHVERLHQRADTYFPMIERVLAEEGVPDELKYLAMVESALNPIAQSHMAAAGLWQFIRATGAAYGLEARPDVDDRLDPERATRAAARHLRDLHDRFGDWHLALAGYNCNPAVIARAVARFEAANSRRATFWDIRDAIPRETQAYVPMFIATTLVASNPAGYGLALGGEPGVPYTFDRVPVAAGTPLADVARASGTTEAAVRALNPSFRSSRVPTARESVRIPVGLYADNARALEGLAPRSASGLMAAAESVQFGPRAVRPVAPQERMQALQVAAARQPARPRGGRADAPVNRPAGAAQYAAAPPRELALFEQRQAREAEAAARQADGSTARLAELERREAELARREADAERRLGEAQTLLARAEDTREEVRRTTPVRVVSAPERRAAPAPAPRPATSHRVARGETLSAIAAQHGLTVQQLREWNGIEGNTLHAGRTLRLTGEGAPARRTTARAAAPAPAPTTYQVRSGDTLTAIARQHGVSVADLQQWNGLSGGAIRPGQSLRVSRPVRS